MTEGGTGEFRHIALEGVFHSGKTQWAGLLAQRMGGKVVQDKADNAYLKDFYDEKDGAAFLSQLVFLVNRYHQQSRLVQRDLFEERIFCDYIFEKDKIYAYQTLSDDELVVYDKIYGVFAERVPQARPRHLPADRPAHPDPADFPAGDVARTEHLGKVPPGPHRGLRLFLFQLPGHAAARRQVRRARRRPGRITSTT